MSLLYFQIELGFCKNLYLAKSNTQISTVYVEFAGRIDISILNDDRSTIWNVKQDKTTEAQLKSSKITKQRKKIYAILIFIFFSYISFHFSIENVD